MLTLTKEGRPPEIPGWAPITSEATTIDFLIREWARIAFDDANPIPVRMKAMEALSKHAGMFIERVEVRTIDESRNKALDSLFETMTVQEKLDWLKAAEANHPVEMAVTNLAPPEEPLQLAPPVQPDPVPAKRVTKKQELLNGLPEFLKR